MAKPKRHFFKVFFPNQSSSHLRIPPAFREHIEDESNRRVYLKGPSGGIWKVNLVKNFDGFYFEGGWGEFIADHSLRMGDFLIFRYDGDSRFRVFVLDSTACEKKDAFRANARGGASEEDEEEEEEEENKPLALFRRRVDGKLKRRRGANDLVYERRKKKATSNGKMDISLGSGALIIPKEEEKSYSTSNYSESSGATPTERNRKSLHKYSSSQVSKSEPRLYKKSAPKKIELVNENGSQRKAGGRVKSFISQRRPVTKEEVEKTLARAMLFKSEHPFVVSVMQDAYVYISLFMWIPTWFATKHMPKENTPMTLWDPSGNPWPINYIAYSSNGAFSGGWGKFTFAHNLEKYDVCVFELIEKNEFKVHIYRVVEEINPLLRRGFTTLDCIYETMTFKRIIDSVYFTSICSTPSSHKFKVQGRHFHGET